MHHRQHGLGQAFLLAFGHSADELLQVEGVAIRALDDASERGLVDPVAQDFAGQLLGRAPGERAEPDLPELALFPQIRKLLAHLRARQREHHERPILCDAQSRIDEAHCRQVAPMQILEYEQDRVRAGFGEHEVFERAPHLIAHQVRISMRSFELAILRDRKRQTRQLAQECAHARLLRGRDVAGDAAR